MATKHKVTHLLPGILVPTITINSTFHTISTSLLILLVVVKKIPYVNIMLSHLYIIFRARSLLRVGGARAFFAPSNY